MNIITYKRYFCILCDDNKLLDITTLKMPLYSIYPEDMNKDTWDMNYGYCENCDAILKDKQNKTWVYHTADDTFEYYKFISNTEYKSKMRDKYNEKVLNIVLKQIVNDDFKW